MNFDEDYGLLPHDALAQMLEGRDGDIASLLQQLSVQKCKVMALEQVQKETMDTLTEIANMTDFPCRKKSARGQLKAIQKLTLTRLSQIDPNWDIPFR